MKRYLLFAKYVILLFFLRTYVVSAQINAGFTGSPRNGCSPLVITLTDTSSSVNPITSYNWLITGPNGFSFASNSGLNVITGILDAPGLYTVTLEVCAGLGNCDLVTMPDFFEVFDHPDVSFTASKLIGCVPMTVCFNNNSAANCGTAAGCNVDVGDGTVYSGTGPTGCDFCHTYTSPGIYSVTILQNNSCGCGTDSTFVNVITVGSSPTADFTWDNNFSCTTPFTVNFTDLSTGGISLSHTWLANNIPFSTAQNPSHTFTDGIYNITLIVQALGGCTDTVVYPNAITVENRQAAISSSTTFGCPGEMIQMIDQSTGSPISWSWHIPGVTNIPILAQNPVIQFDDPGFYDVELTVLFPGGCSDTTLLPGYIEIFELPDPSFLISDTLSCDLPAVVDFSSNAANGASWEWTFPGGNPALFSGQNPPSVVYNNFGLYDAALMVTDGNGCIDSLTVSEAIEVEPLEAIIYADHYGGCAPLMVTFTAGINVSDSIFSYQWDLNGDGIVDDNSMNPSFNYPDTGCYNISVIVATANGCIDTAIGIDLICVGNPPSGSLSLSPATVCFDDMDVCFTFTGTAFDSLVWYYGDGNIGFSSDSTICYAYEDIGAFTPAVASFNNGCAGDSLSLAGAVTVHGPLAAFRDSLDCSGQQTHYFINESADYDSIFWDFGDTASHDTSSQEVASWHYSTPGLFDVTLWAFNFSTGCVHQVTQQVFVQLPDAYFKADDSVGCAPFSTIFRNISPDWTPYIKSQWDFNGPVGGLQLAGWQATNQPHTFTEPGLYSVALTNVLPNGCRDTIVREDYIAVHGSFVRISASDTLGCRPLEVVFSSDSSYAPLSHIVSWHWDFGDGTTSADPNPFHLYDSTGCFTVSLTLTDSFGCVSSDTFPDFVCVQDYETDFLMSDTFICSGQSISLTNITPTTDLDFSWVLNGGTPGTITPGTDTTVRYDTEGLYQVVLIAINPTTLCADSVVRNLHVFNPVANFSVDTFFAPCPPLVVNFIDSSENNITAWNWTFGNGNTATGSSPSIIITAAGQPEITLIVTSGSGCKDTISKSPITVEGPVASMELTQVGSNCPCVDYEIVIETINTISGTFLAGNGSLSTFVPDVVGTAGNPSRDTLHFNYCNVGSYIPQLSISDAVGCNLVLTAADNIHIDTPVVSFTYNATGTCGMGQVCFSDQSTSQIPGAGVNSWTWHFGDGASDTTQNPCHSYQSSGTYTVTLIGKNAAGCADTFSQNVIIPVSPVADFAISDTVGCVPMDVVFSDLSTTDSSTGVSSWFWYFGNPAAGATSTLPNPLYTYQNSGSYVVSLAVTDSFGCADTASKTLVVNDPAPIVFGFSDSSICQGDSIMLSASGGIAYAWSPSNSLLDSSQADPYAFPEGSIVYYLNMTDSNNCNALDSLVVEVAQVTANFVPDTVCLMDTSGFLNLSGSSNGVIQSWNWDFGDPASGADNYSGDQNPLHYYGGIGVYPVSLEVFDMNGCTADTLLNAVVSTIPTVDFSFDTVCAGDSTHFLDLSTAGIGSIVYWDWDFGDGYTSLAANPVHMYQNAGTYTVCLSVTNSANCGGSIQLCQNVLVLENPVAAFGADTVCFGNVTTLTDLSLQAGNAPLQQWNWNFGDPAGGADSSSLQDPQYLYSIPGIHAVYLSVVDVKSCTSDTIIDVWVNALPTALFSQDSSCLGDSVLFEDLSLNGSGTIDSWQWDFDYPNAILLAAAQDTLFEYQAPGIYSVQLAVTDEFGCDDDTIIDVLISQIPTAQFQSDSVCAGVPLQFINSSIPGSGSVDSYSWALGDGSIDSLSQPIYTYQSGGTYGVSLTVVNSFGCVDATSQQVLVYDLPVADFTSDSVCLGTPTVFIDLSSDGSGLIIDYFWDFGDMAGSSVDKDPNHFYLTSGNFMVMQMVEDQNGCRDTFERAAIVHALPSAGFDPSGTCENTAISFVDTSHTGDFGINSWNWNFDEPGLVSNLQMPVVVFQQSGIHQIELIVIDFAGCTDTLVRTLDIHPAPVAAHAASSIDTCADAAVCFTDLTALPPGVNAVAWEWDMESDGVIDDISQNPCYIYTTAGNFNSQMIVTDDNGCKDTSQLQVNVSALPKVEFSWDPACEGTPMSFTDLSTSTNSTINGWLWDFGNGMTSNEQDPVNTYADSGHYTVQLFTTSAAGCVSSLTSVVNVDWMPNVWVLPEDTVICPGESVELKGRGATSFEWTPKRWLDQSITSRVLSTPSFNIDYQVTGFNGACPPSVANASIKVLQDIALEINADPEAIIQGANSQLTVTSSGNFDEVQWTPSEHLSCTDCIDPIASPVETTTYLASIVWGIKDAQRCSKSDSVTIEVIRECHDDLLYLPNAFTPNGDGTNDLFYVRGIGVQQVLSFIVYDRWGSLIFEQSNFEANDRQFGWDGRTPEGKKLNSATFVYAVEALCLNGEKISRRGAVNLLR